MPETSDFSFPDEKIPIRKFVLDTRRGDSAISSSVYNTFPLREYLFLAARERGLVREVDAALAIDLFHDHRHYIAHFHHVFHFLDAVMRELGDVDEAFLVRQYFRERSEVHDTGDATLEELSRLHFACEILDPFYRLGSAGFIHGGDEDGSVILDIDRDTGLIDDLIDHLAARPDDISDLLRVDMNRDDARRIRGKVLARRFDRFKHLAHDEHTAFFRLGDSRFERLRGKTVDLHVHLHGRDAVFGTCYLEVHIAIVVFETLDIGQYLV